MTKGQRVGDLEVAQDLTFQRRSWTVQRIGWVAMALVLLAALAGLTGSGPLSQATAGAAGDPLRVAYPRFARHRAPTTLEVHLAPGAGQGGTVRVWVNAAYLRGATVEAVYPEPERVEAGPGRVTYVFALEQPGQPTTIAFQLLHDAKWRQRVAVGLGDREPVRFRQFIYP